jgi:hypothetical protein
MVFKEYHLLKTRIAIETVDYANAWRHITTCARCPEANFAIAVDWDSVNNELAKYAKILGAEITKTGSPPNRL